MLEPKEFFVLQEFEHREIFPEKEFVWSALDRLRGLPCGPVRGKHGLCGNHGTGRQAPGDL